ncbi:uncharacterized protein LOC111399831 [Olea europaea subsp. europaea]|uniref:Uncharacterized protein LOC111399831 n=1 Tax=Olea europaea subsp. europaea TaxID=158383 RepID=A0A8S0SVR4_OLEEU|nr:uncharacterized protein LOC111399831 [Olea europaea subsp. europaea]
MGDVPVIRAKMDRRLDYFTTQIEELLQLFLRGVGNNEQIVELVAQTKVKELDSDFENEEVVHDGSIFTLDYEQILYRMYLECTQGCRTISGYTNEFMRLMKLNNLSESKNQRVVRRLLPAETSLSVPSDKGKALQQAPTNLNSSNVTTDVGLGIDVRAERKFVNLVKLEAVDEEEDTEVEDEYVGVEFAIKEGCHTPNISVLEVADSRKLLISSLETTYATPRQAAVGVPIDMVGKPSRTAIPHLARSISLRLDLHQYPSLVL